MYVVHDPLSIIHFLIKEPSHFFLDQWYTKSAKAFLFSVKNHDNHSYKLPIYSGRLDYAIFTHSSYGPTFGRGLDLHIADKCNTNTNSYSHLGNTYELPAGYTYGTTEAQSLLAGSYPFEVDEYEVFYQS